MGFRNPITTATAVDTGHGLADAGVRLYQDLTRPAVPTGVAEWRTGAMQRNATAQLSGGGSGGSAFTIDGGAAVGVDAPTIQQNVEALPAGGYGPVLRLTARPAEGGRIVPDVALDPIVAKSALPLFTASFVPFNAAYDAPSAAKLASGLVVCSGMATVSNLNFGLGQTVATLPAGMRPLRIHRYICQGFGYGAWIAEVAANGQIQYAGGAIGSSPSAGSYISFEGIAFLAEQ